MNLAKVKKDSKGKANKYSRKEKRMFCGPGFHSCGFLSMGWCPDDVPSTPPPTGAPGEASAAKTEEAQEESKAAETEANKKVIENFLQAQEAKNAKEAAEAAAAAAAAEEEARSRKWNALVEQHDERVEG